MSKKTLYRALIGTPQLESENVTKAEMEPIVLKEIDKVMPHWNSSAKVKPYPAMFADADKMYATLGQGTPSSPDDAAKQLATAYGDAGMLFTTDKPRGHKKDDTRTAPSPNTGLYVYTTCNPDGWFDSYSYPITHSYNGIDARTSKLAHHGYGTMNDMLEVGDLDWEATYLPSVAFVYWEDSDGKTKKKHYDMIDRSPMDSDTDAEWAQKLQDFYTEKLGRHGIISMVECSM